MVQHGYRQNNRTDYLWGQGQGNKLQVTPLKTVCVPSRFKLTISWIQVRHVTAWANFPCKVHISQDINVCFQATALKSLLVQKWTKYSYHPWLISFPLTSIYSATFPTSLTSTLKMDTVYSSETFVPAYDAARCHDPKNHNMYACENCSTFCQYFRDSGKTCPIFMIRVKKQSNLKYCHVR
jgi:hypothetical protein